MKALRVLLASVLLASAFLVTGCVSASDGTVQVPRIPAWEASTDTKVYTTADISPVVRQLAPFASLDTADVKFVALSHAWLEKAVTFSWHFGKATGLGDWQEEVWDCDDFADGFARIANVAAKRAGVKAQPLLARLYVTQTNPFGGVGVGGGHALNAFYSDRPPHFFVLEPQSRALVPLDAYPNRQFIFRVKL